MNIHLLTAFACAAAAAAAPFAASAAAAAQEHAVSFKAGDGADRGTARIAAGPTGVLVRLDLKGLPPGWHAIHFHAKGDCSDAAFQNSGGHINHAQPKPHGLLNPQGPDMGDLPNVYAAADGSVRAEVFSALVTMSGLMDADGSALVLHASADDYMTQPIGGAGARIACAVIK